MMRRTRGGLPGKIGCFSRRSIGLEGRCLRLLGDFWPHEIRGFRCVDDVLSETDDDLAVMAEALVLRKLFGCGRLGFRHEDNALAAELFD